MKKREIALIVLCLLAALVPLCGLDPGSGGGIAVLAQGTPGTGVRYFSETGHNVQGEFLAFFERYGGEEIFGLPRTEELYQGGLKVQYFQRVRMEYHPYNPQPYKVQLALLGDLLGYRQPGIPAYSIPAPDHPQRRYYPQTGHTLSYGFLQYFDSHGGLDVFGYPITELIPENGTVVQYFQRAKMEWHPENAFGHEITLGNLGDEYIARAGLPPSALARATPLSAPLVVSPVWPLNAVGGEPTPTPTLSPAWTSAAQFSVSVWVKYPITGQRGFQTVYVRATASNGQGVRDAAVEVIVHGYAGERIFRAANTDAYGCSALNFNIDYAPPGYTVIIEVRVTYAGRMETTQTYFIVWA